MFACLPIEIHSFITASLIVLPFTVTPISAANSTFKRRGGKVGPCNALCQLLYVAIKNGIIDKMQLIFAVSDT